MLKFKVGDIVVLNQTELRAMHGDFSPSLWHCVFEVSSIDSIYYNLVAVTGDLRDLGKLVHIDIGGERLIVLYVKPKKKGFR